MAGTSKLCQPLEPTGGEEADSPPQLLRPMTREGYAMRGGQGEEEREEGRDGSGREDVGERERDYKRGRGEREGDDGGLCVCEKERKRWR